VITVADTTAPNLTALPAPSTIECPATPSFTTPTATDACDASPTLSFADVTTPGACPQEYSVRRTWTATDHCGHSTTASQTINVRDTTSPRVVWPGDVNLTCTDCNIDPANTGQPSPSDACGTVSISHTD